MKLSEKLLKNSTIKQTSTITDSKLLNEIDITSTPVPIINVALSGDINGGLSSGITLFAGKSKHFKSNFCLLLAEAYLKKHEDSVLLFYDCEFGAPKAYFEAMGIDPDRVIHCPIETVEDLKHDLTVQLNNIERGDKVIIILDSLGNIASKKETEDALEGKNTVDMTRAKAIKSLFRIITVRLKMRNIPMLVIGHTYETQCLDGSTLIKTTKGFMEIKDIMVGDKVFTNNGIQNVSHTYGPSDLDPQNKTYLELEFDDNHKIKCTHDHLFLMKDKTWKKAIDIKIDEEFY